MWGNSHFRLAQMSRLSPDISSDTYPVLVLPSFLVLESTLFPGSFRSPSGAVPVVTTACACSSIKPILLQLNTFNSFSSFDSVLRVDNSVPSGESRGNGRDRLSG